MDAEPLIIGGEPTEAADGRTFDVIEPATGSPMATVAQAGPSDAARAVDVARHAFDTGAWRRTSATARGRVLAEAARIVRERLEDLATLEARNGGKPIAAARGEIGLVANVFEYWAGAANKIFGETIPVQDPGLDVTIREPVGVCALIVPVELPAGDRVLEDRARARVRERHRGQAGQPHAAVGVEARGHPGRSGPPAGDDQRPARARVRSPAKRWSRTLPSTRSGSPVPPRSVRRSWPWLRSASPASPSSWAGSRRTCCSRTRTWRRRPSHRSGRSSTTPARTAARARGSWSSAPRTRDFVAAFTALTGRIVVGPPLDEDTQMGPLISSGQRQRAIDYVAIGREEGARVTIGGDVPTGPGRGRRLLPPSRRARGRPQRHARRAGRDLRARGLHHPLRHRGGGHRASPTTPTTACPPRSGPATWAARSGCRRASGPASCPSTRATASTPKHPSVASSAAGSAARWVCTPRVCTRRSRTSSSPKSPEGSPARLGPLASLSKHPPNGGCGIGRKPYTVRWLLGTRNRGRHRDRGVSRDVRSMDVPAKHGRDRLVTVFLADAQSATLIWVVAAIGVAALIAAAIIAWVSHRSRRPPPPALSHERVRVRSAAAKHEPHPFRPPDLPAIAMRSRRRRRAQVRPSRATSATSAASAGVDGPMGGTEGQPGGTTAGWGARDRTPGTGGPRARS